MLLALSLLGPNRNKRSTCEREDRCQEGASEQESNTGMIIGVVCTCLLAGVGVLLLVVKRNKLVAFIRKRKGHEGTYVSRPRDITLASKTLKAESV